MDNRADMLHLEVVPTHKHNRIKFLIPLGLPSYSLSATLESMQAESPTIKLKVSLLQDSDGKGLTNRISFLDPAFTKVTLRPEYRKHSFYVSSPSEPQPPAWFGFAKSLSMDATEIEHLSRITPSFILILKFSQRAYVVTGGHAHHIISVYTDGNFGLELFSRIVEEDDIVKYRNKFISGDLSTREEASRLKGFGIRTLLQNNSQIIDLMQSVTLKKTLEKALSFELKGRSHVRLEGKDSFVIHKSFNIDDLISIVSRFDEILNREPNFPIHGGFSVVKDPEMRNFLNHELRKNFILSYRDFVQAPDEFVETVGLSHRLLDSVEECDTWVFTLGKASYSFDVFQISSLFEGLLEGGKERMVLSHLAGATLRGASLENDTIPLPDQPIVNFLYGAVVYKSVTYIHFDNQWLLVKPNTLNTIEESVQSIKIQSEEFTSSLPQLDWRRGDSGRVVSEEAYMDDLLGVDSDIEYLHRDYVIVESQNRGEICDLATATNSLEMYFIKIGAGSQFRELCAQVRSTSWQIRFDERFVERALEKFSTLPIVSGPDLQEAAYILVFVDTKKNTSIDLSDRLTFIAKLEIFELMRFFRLYLPQTKLVLKEIPKAV